MSLRANERRKLNLEEEFCRFLYELFLDLSIFWLCQIVLRFFTIFMFTKAFSLVTRLVYWLTTSSLTVSIKKTMKFIFILTEKWLSLPLVFELFRIELLISPLSSWIFERKASFWKSSNCACHTKQHFWIYVSNVPHNQNIFMLEKRKNFVIIQNMWCRRWWRNVRGFSKRDTCAVHFFTLDA